MEAEANGDWKSAYTRVLGETLGTCIGRKVLMIAEVKNVHPSGASMVVQTTDKSNVSVQLEGDAMDLPQGLVELRGIVTSGSAINCEDMIKFETDPQNFDAETYNNAVRMILQGSTPWSL